MKINRGAALSLLATTLLVSACAGVEVRPAPQGPRYYTAAHDTIDGDCRKERNSEYTVDDHRPLGPTGVRCLMEQTAQPTLEEKIMDQKMDYKNKKERIVYTR